MKWAEKPKCHALPEKNEHVLRDSRRQQVRAGGNDF
jgi:hypothetical protein